MDTGRVKWAENDSSFQLIPEEKGSEVFLEGFMKFLKAKKLTPSSAQEQLSALRIAKASLDKIAEDHRCKYESLEAYSSYLSSEVLRLTTMENDTLRQALVAQAKLSLRSVGLNFQSFLKARLVEGLHP